MVNFTHQRNGTLTKWIAGLATTLLVLLVVGLVSLDRQEIKRDSEEALQRSLHNDKDIAVLKNTLSRVEKRQEEILGLLKEMKE